MIENLEILAANKTIYSDEELESLNEVCLLNAIHGINLYGSHLDVISKLDNHARYYINIDIPYSRNVVNAVYAIQQVYHKEYGSIIDGYNFGIPYYLILDDKQKINDYFLRIKELSKDKECRLFVDLSALRNHDDMFHITNLCQNSKIDKIILGHSNKKFGYKFISKLSNMVQKQTQYKFGIFSFNMTLEEVESEIINQFNPIILHPKNFVDNYEQ